MKLAPIAIWNQEEMPMVNETEKRTPAEGMRGILNQWAEAARAQKENRIDYETQQDVDTMSKALEDAAAAFQTQRNQNDIDTARALDNAALYAEARGDRGGIGQAQYNEIQAAALQNRQQINSAQTRLASDTARDIAALRAKGEFEKADALLEVSQKYLSQLMTLERWSANWDLTQAQMQRSLEQWEKNNELSRSSATGYLSDGTPTRTTQKEQAAQLASAGEALLKVGVMPSSAQLSAMGMTSSQAQAYINSLMIHGKL